MYYIYSIVSSDSKEIKKKIRYSNIFKNSLKIKKRLAIKELHPKFMITN